MVVEGGATFAPGAFNRTTMELKQRGRVNRFVRVFAFNRTTMELKLGSEGFSDNQVAGF